MAVGRLDSSSANVSWSVHGNGPTARSALGLHCRRRSRGEGSYVNVFGQLVVEVGVKCVWRGGEVEAIAESWKFGHVCVRCV